MKKFATCFFALFLAAPALAAGNATTISRVIPGTNSANDGAATARATAQSAEKASSATATTSTTSPSRSAVVSRVVGANTTAQSGARDGTAPTRNVTPSRATAASGSVSTSTRSKLDTAVNTVGRNARTANTGINSTAAVRRAGLVLRPSTAEVGGRAKISGTNIQTGSNVGTSARALQSRAATTLSRESIAAAKERMESVAELNNTCQTQYNDCMDQFCAVIDANQKRCSCSANLSRYTKVEAAVKEANTQLNDVAQRIRYVGLSADEIRAIMSATEAEEALSGTKDTTETRNMLADIEEMIKNPTSNTSSSGDNFSMLDLNLDFSSDSSDLFNLDFLNQNKSSVSSMRGTDLFKAAKKSCNAVLTQCKSAGADTEQIVANYELAMDKDCIAYEQGLTKMNETLVSNVRSANLMLQKARLAVLQNKNQYDAKGCIAALDTCMTDDMVCGEGYTKCLDPTKQFIDENGKVVLGRDITNITAFMENYNNAEIDATYLGNVAGISITEQSCRTGNDGRCLVKYLMNKIGTGAKVADNGLCRAVLDKCQRYTYSTSGTYNPYNDIVVNYIQRAMVNVKAAQHQIISDYASNCMLDIATCYNQQVTQVNAWSSNASVSSIRNVMRGACRNVALTCAYAVFSADKKSCPSDNQETCLNSVSEMFYQSMLCPDNSIYDDNGGTISANDTPGGFVNAHCKCKPGYVVWGTSCIPQCEGGRPHDSYGACSTSSTGSNTTGGTGGNTTGNGDSTTGDGDNQTDDPKTPGNQGGTVDCTKIDANSEPCKGNGTCLGPAIGCQCKENFTLDNNNKCQCADPYILDNGACRAKTCAEQFGEHAIPNPSCGTVGLDTDNNSVLTCISAGCECDSGHRPAGTPLTCQPTQTAANCNTAAHQEVKADCTGADDATGCVAQYCGCATGYKAKNGQCVAYCGIEGLRTDDKCTKADDKWTPEGCAALNCRCPQNTNWDGANQCTDKYCSGRGVITVEELEDMITAGTVTEDKKGNYLIRDGTCACSPTSAFPQPSTDGVSCEELKS